MAYHPARQQPFGVLPCRRGLPGNNRGRTTFSKHPSHAITKGTFQVRRCVSNLNPRCQQFRQIGSSAYSNQFRHGCQFQTRHRLNPHPVNGRRIENKFLAPCSATCQKKIQYWLRKTRWPNCIGILTYMQGVKGMLQSVRTIMHMRTGQFEGSPMNQAINENMHASLFLIVRTGGSV